MSVRIQNDGVTGASELGRSGEISRSGAEKSGQGSGTQATDRVEISSLSENIAASVSAANVQQANRISHLAALYASGRYHVDPADISRALVGASIQPSSDTGGNA